MKEKIKYMLNTAKSGIEEFAIGTKKMFKEFFNKETNKKQRANMWTFMRLIIPLITIILSICAITIASPALFLVTGGVASFGAITDYLDGKSSRKHNSSSAYGKLLDQVADKIFAGVVCLNLLFINPNYLIILLGELLISAINIGYKVKYNDLDITSTKTGKIKEWPLFLSLALGFLTPVSPALKVAANMSIYLTSLFQIFTAKSYIDNNNNEVKALNKNKLLDQIDEFIEKSNEEEKEFEKTNQNAKIKQYKELRDVLTQIIETQKVDNNMLEDSTNNIQKKKEL